MLVVCEPESELVLVELGYKWKGLQRVESPMCVDPSNSVFVEAAFSWLTQNPLKLARILPPWLNQKF